MAVSASFEVGDRFSSYSDLCFRIKAFEKGTVEHLRQPRKRVPKRVEVAKAELISHSISVLPVYLVGRSTRIKELDKGHTRGS